MACLTGAFTWHYIWYTLRDTPCNHAMFITKCNALKFRCGLGSFLFLWSFACLFLPRGSKGSHSHAVKAYVVRRPSLCRGTSNRSEACVLYRQDGKTSTYKYNQHPPPRGFLLEYIAWPPNCFIFMPPNPSAKVSGLVDRFSTVRCTDVCKAPL